MHPSRYTKAGDRRDLSSVNPVLGSLWSPSPEAQRSQRIDLHSPFIHFEEEG